MEIYLIVGVAALLGATAWCQDSELFSQKDYYRLPPENLGI